MDGTRTTEVIDLVSSDEDRAPSDDEAMSWSEGDAPGASDSDDLLPAVGPAVGDEDEEDSSDDDVQMRIPSPPEYEPPQPGQRAPMLNARVPYIMNHLTPSMPIPVSVPVPDLFTRMGLRSSGHFDQYLRGEAEESLEASPHTEGTSREDAELATALKAMRRREAENLSLYRDLLLRTRQELDEVYRAEFLLVRMATGPVMQAAARAQGAVLEVPEELQNLAAGPRQRFIYGTGGAHVVSSSTGGAATAASTRAAAPTAAGASSSSTGAPPSAPLAGPSRLQPIRRAAPPSTSSRRLEPSPSDPSHNSGRSAMRRAFVEADEPVIFRQHHTGVLEEPLGDTATRRATSRRSGTQNRRQAGPSTESAGGSSAPGGLNHRGGPRDGHVPPPNVRPQTSRAGGLVRAPSEDEDDAHGRARRLRRGRDRSVSRGDHDESRRAKRRR